VALGTVVDPNGYVLTKASQLGDDLSVRMAGGDSLPADVIGVHEPFDLALLKVDARGLPGVSWNRGEAPAVGSLLAAPGPDGQALAAGVVSVAPRRPMGARGFLGVGHELTDDGVRVTGVLEGTAADSAGIQTGDIIRQVNDVTIRNPMELNEAVGNQDPGTKIRLQLQRKDRTIDAEAVLGTRRISGVRLQRFNLMDRMGSRLSDRRDGFPFVLQHDCVLAPEECGGPLVDLSGQVVGINIARAGRVASYAAPANEVLAVLPDLMSGKLAPPEPTVAEKLEQLDDALKRAEAAAAAANNRAGQLQEQIERLKAERRRLQAAEPSDN
jgi:serine protease Do